LLNKNDKARDSKNNGRPLVSFVTPCYNSAKFIECCIKSVLYQDYHYVEHVIQDGASTDGTIDVLKKYTDKIYWVSEPDNGQSDGLNKALKRSKGDIILVLNADDELLSNAASWGVRNMAKYPDAAVVYGDQYTIDSKGKIINAYRCNHTYDFVKLLCVELVPPAQAAFIRRSYFEQVGLYADTKLDTCPDYEMWVRIGMKFPMVYVPGFVAKYRWHTDSEGRQKDIVHKMVYAKRIVMDRVFNNPDTPPEIKVLRSRAYSSLNIWAAGMLMGIKGGRFKALHYLYQALKIDLSFHRFYEASNMLLGQVINFYCNTIIGIKRIFGVSAEIDKHYN
jgi:glycosyltransferase involved in cell wall biosynthesis